MSTYYGSCADCSATWTETGGKSLSCPDCGSRNVTVSDEPHGAGADPFNRPDPATHPETWSE